MQHRLPLALMYLADSDLPRTLGALADALFEAGDLRAILLTGLLLRPIYGEYGVEDSEAPAAAAPTASASPYPIGPAPNVPNATNTPNIPNAPTTPASTTQPAQNVSNVLGFLGSLPPELQVPLLLQRYVDRTADVQSAALFAVSCFEGLVDISPFLDERVHSWISAYVSSCLAAFTVASQFNLIQT